MTIGNITARYNGDSGTWLTYYTKYPKIQAVAFSLNKSLKLLHSSVKVNSPYTS